MPAIPSIAEIRDAMGQPAAVGATVTLRKLFYKKSTIGHGDPDSLHVGVGESETGPFDVYVTKPYYTEVIVKNIYVSTDKCGISEPARVKVVLSLLPDAPPVRRVVVQPSGSFYGWGNMKERMFANVVAAPGVSKQIIWSSSDPTVATITPDGLLTTMCPKSGGNTLITAISAVDPTKQASFDVTVYIIDMPGNGCPPR